VLAFSGGLDTSFCIPYLKERGYAVHTVFADTGGVDAEERAYIEARAHELGAASHVTVDGGPAIWSGFVKPFIWAGEGYQGQYPLLVSDRYLIVDAAIARANEIGTRAIAHGCTGMGNDQVRFDLAVKALGDYEIVAPIREVRRNTEVRAYEQRYPKRSASTSARRRRLAINENLLGLTMSGGEIDRWEAPGDGARGWCATRDWPAQPRGDDNLRLRRGRCAQWQADRPRCWRSSTATSRATASAGVCTPATRRSDSRAASSSKRRD
jgi:argininosuccinate synthase